MSWTVWLAVLLGLAAPELPGAAGLAGYYKGSIHVTDPDHGNRRHDVVLELKVDGTALSGTCLYLGGERIAIRGTVDKPGASFRLELLEIGREPPVVWQGWATAAHALWGSWSGLPGARGGSFQLERDDSARRYLEAKGAAVAAEAVAYRIEPIPGTEVLLPTLTRFRDPRVMRAVNRRLAALGREAHCDEPGENHELEAEVAYAAQDVFSVRITQTCTEYPGPSRIQDLSLSFDLATGEVATFPELFKERVSSQEIATAAFAYELAAARKPGARADADACLDQYGLENLSRSLLTFFFSEDGLVVRPDWGVVHGECADEVTVPYPALAALAAPEGLLARVAAAHAGAAMRYRIHRPGSDAAEDALYTP